MLGLGNGRRGMKSPPLLVAVLLACVIVLGINYWISSSRSIELQSRVMELEGRMRRAAAERGAVEIKKNEFEEQLANQKGQIEEIQSLHMTQLESFNTKCINEKALLLKNLTFKDQLLVKLQAEMKDLANNYGTLQQELELFRESQAKKLSFELEQCSNKMKEMNDQCEERLKKITEKGENIGVVKTEGQVEPALPKESEDQNPGPVQQEEKDKAGNDIVPRPTIKKEEQGEKDKADAVDSEKIANEIGKAISEAQVPPQNPSNASKDVNNLPAEPGKEPDAYEDEDTLEGAEEEDTKPEQQADQLAKKEINNEEVEREQLLNLDEQEDKDMTQDEIDQANQEADGENEDVKLPDYNGEEGNEPEPEAKKQAELAGNEINLKGPMNNENAMNDQQQARQKEDREQRLK